MRLGAQHQRISFIAGGLVVFVIAPVEARRDQFAVFGGDELLQRRFGVAKRRVA